MLLKIFVTKSAEDLFTKDLGNNKFPIFIGRDEKNDIFLEDHFKIISRKHAQITERGNSFYLTDLDSQNFTYLNGQRIQPNEDTLIQTGDKIKIGEYQLEIQVIEEEIQIPEEEIPINAEQKTMVFSAPFEEELNAISENLKSIAQKFSSDNSEMKNEMLRFSLMQKFNSMERSVVNKIFAEFFGDRFLEKKSPNISEKENKSHKSFVKHPEVMPDYSNEEQVKYDNSFSSHFSNVTDTLLNAFSKLFLGCMQFRQEFFGVTMYQILPVNSLKDIKEYLFDPTVSSEEEKKRLELLKDETQKLLAHQIGLLEGYRISIIEGTKNLLQSLDPENVEKEGFRKESFLDKSKVFSFVQKAKLFDAVKKVYGKYHSDPYYIEKKFFRPAFMRGYQKRNSASKSTDEF